jgi:hypothetical protein
MCAGLLLCLGRMLIMSLVTYMHVFIYLRYYCYKAHIGLFDPDTKTQSVLNSRRPPLSSQPTLLTMLLIDSLTLNM